MEEDSPTVMVQPLERPETILVWSEHLACALTVYVPPLDQDLEALVEEDQSERDPSPQSKRYWRL